MFHLNDSRYYHFARGKVLNVDAIVSRTGYTGEDGFEIYFSAEIPNPFGIGLLEARHSVSVCFLQDWAREIRFGSKPRCFCTETTWMGRRHCSKPDSDGS